MCSKYLEPLLKIQEKHTVSVPECLGLNFMIATLGTKSVLISKQGSCSTSSLAFRLYRTKPTEEDTSIPFITDFEAV
jgi:hypothetical protein